MRQERGPGRTNDSVWVRSTSQELVDQNSFGMRSLAFSFEGGYWYDDLKSWVISTRHVRQVERCEDVKSSGEPAGMAGVLQNGHLYAAMWHLLLEVGTAEDQLGYHLVIGERRAYGVRQWRVATAVPAIDVNAMLANQKGSHVL
ncbi:hypothetical protein VDGL01_12685 [Verticillium dahliae]